MVKSLDLQNTRPSTHRVLSRNLVSFLQPHSAVRSMSGIQGSHGSRRRSLVAIPPQTPDHSLSLQEKHNVRFPVLSDSGDEVASSWGLSFELDGDLKVVQEQFGVDIPSFNGGLLLISISFLMDGRCSIHLLKWTIGNDLRETAIAWIDEVWRLPSRAPTFSYSSLRQMNRAPCRLSRAGRPPEPAIERSGLPLKEGMSTPNCSWTALRPRYSSKDNPELLSYLVAAVRQDGKSKTVLLL